MGKEDVTIRVGADLAGAMEGIGKLIGKFGDIATTGNLVKGVFGGVFAYGAREMSKMVDEVVAMNHELQVTARNTGASVEDIQGWTKNAAKYGKSVEDVTGMIEKLELAMEKARKEGSRGKITMALEKLGVDKNMNGAEAFKSMNESLSKSGTIMGHMTELADIFGAKMVKNTKMLTENLEAAKKSLSDRGALIDELTSRQLEDVRKMDKEMGTYGSRLIRPEHQADLAVGVTSAKTMFKSLFVLIDEAFSMGPNRPGFKKAWENYGERAGQMQASQGYRMGPGWVSPVEYERMRTRLEEREGRRAELKSGIKDLQYELKTPAEKMEEARKNVTVAKEAYDKFPATKTSVEKLQAQKDLLTAQLELKKLQGTNTMQMQSNPFLQIGGLMGVDISTRIADASERTAINTEGILARLSGGTTPAPVLNQSPLPPSGLNYTGTTSATGGRNFTVPGTSVTGTDFSQR